MTHSGKRLAQNEREEMRDRPRRVMTDRMTGLLIAALVIATAIGAFGLWN